jgi:hypothetical protein
LTAEGSPRERFRRGVEGGWIFHADVAAREAGNLKLADRSNSSAYMKS